jgi:hypothetical protein
MKLNQAYKDNRSKLLSPKKEKNACISDDVARIIRSTPDLWPSKAEEASLWLFSLYTGARAISSTAICLKDMVLRDKVLRVRIRVTKGNLNWNHHV